MNTIWGQDPPAAGAQVLRFENLGAAVCADGANGLRRVSAAEARSRGLYVRPGQDLVPLVAYWPDDLGPVSKWSPPGRSPMGLDAPENQDEQLLVQGPLDPAPGALLSETALQDERFQKDDARRYFDSAGVPGWVLPGNLLAAHGVRLGDLAAVTYRGITVWCQAYDVGPTHSSRLEISVNACRRLGIKSCARSGGTEDGVSVVMYPGSRSLGTADERVRPWTAAGFEEISAKAAVLLKGK